MGYPASPRLRQARCAIIGFGCNQAFLFTMLYLDGSVAGPVDVVRRCWGPATGS